MTWIQLRQPNVNVPCTPGWCLNYVQRVFGIDANVPTALADWDRNTYNHADANFPAGVAVPVWFTGAGGLLKDDGHVAVRMPDGSIWSASNPTSTQPMHFPSIAALNQYYSNQLVYLGWTEDVEDVKVIEENTMNETINLDTARILAFQCWARDGRDGRPNAHKGECDDDLNRNHVGHPLTNEEIRLQWFASQEAGNAFVIKDQVYGERDNLRQQVQELHNQIDALSKSSGASNPQDAADAAKYRALKAALGLQ